MGWPVGRVMSHLTKATNMAFISKKGFPNENPPIFVSNTISDFRFWSCSGMQGGDYSFPLYLYPSESELGFDTERKPNLDETIWRQINDRIGNDALPEDIFDYIYGVLHSPNYREKYKEFLKVDFPRIPYPKNAEEFEHFRNYGHQLRELHLMHNIPASSVTFPESGNMLVEQTASWEDGKVHINATQYFDNVPREAWEMYIGGYQPAQKWLKDRKGRKLTSDDVEHYCKIISVLMETSRLTKEIDATIY